MALEQLLPPVLIGFGIVLLLLFWLVVRLSSRLAVLQNLMQDGQGIGEKLERGLRAEMADNRRETGETLRQNREELNTAIQRLDSALHEKLEHSRRTMEEKLGAFQTAQQSQAEQLRQMVDDKLSQVQADARKGREEMGLNLQRFGESQQEQTGALGILLKNQMETFTGQLGLQLTTFTQTSEQALVGIRATLEERLGQAQQDARQGRTEQSDSLKTFGEQITGHLHHLTQRNAEGMETLRQTLEAKLSAIQTDNSQKLEQMRLTVDEKLHNTLEQRLGESFKLVSERLEQVHKGLGKCRP